MPQWTTAQVIAILVAAANKYGLDPDIVQAIARVESGLNPHAARYEPNYKFLLSPDQWAIRLLITKDTEERFQKMSLGVMQVMGALARELGHTGHLSELFDPEVAAEYGCKYLARQKKRFDKEDMWISSYNAGTPQWDSANGEWKNQKYIDRVKGELKRLRDLRQQSVASGG